MSTDKEKRSRDELLTDLKRCIEREKECTKPVVDDLVEHLDDDVFRSVLDSLRTQTPVESAEPGTKVGSS